MATSAFKSTTRRAPMGTSSPSTDDSATSSSSKAHRRSRSLSRFSRPVPAELESGVLPTPRRKFVNTVRGSGLPEISLDDLAMELFSAKDNSSEVDEESGSSRSSRPARRNPEISAVTTSSQRRSRSVSRHNNYTSSSIAGGASATASSQRRGRSVSRRNDGTASNASGTARAVPNVDSRRRRSVSVARYQISDSESDIDHLRRSAGHAMSRNINHGNSQIASFQRPTASSNRRLSRSMSQTPRLRSHDDYSSQSSALTDDESRDVHHGKNEIEKTIRAVYAQKKIDPPTGDDANHGLYEAMRKELRSAVNEIMMELEQTIERKPSALAVHDRLHPNKSNGLQTVSSMRKNYTTKLKQPKQELLAETSKDGSKIVREVLIDSNSNANPQRVSHSRKVLDHECNKTIVDYQCNQKVNGVNLQRSNDRNRVSKRLNEEAEKYFEDFISNIEDTDFSSFDGERSDTSSTLVGTTRQRDECNSVPVEMEGVNLPWLNWDNNDDVTPINKNTKNLLWDPSQDLGLIQEQSSSHDSRETKFNMEEYVEIERSEELLFDNWRERSIIRNGGLLLCGNILL